jgi:hypothetical protein
MKIARKLTRYFLNHPAIFILAAFVFAGSVYSATTIGSNITTAGNLEVTGNATTTGSFYVGADDEGALFSRGLVSINASSLFNGLSVYLGGTAPDNTTDYSALRATNKIVAGGAGVVKRGVYGVALASSDIVGNLIGVEGKAQSIASTVSNMYGGYFSSSKPVGSNATASYGIYATASGGDVNYAGYFDGDVKTTGALTPAAGESAPATPVEGSFAVDTAEQDCFDAGDGTDGGSLCVYTGAAWVVAKTW